MQVRYRDRWLLVVDKPAGQPTQSTDRGEPGLFEALKANEEQVFLHHRLDRPASGLVLFAVHPAANKGITKALRGHTIDRRYRVVLAGAAEPGEWRWKVDRKSARSSVRVLGQGAGLTAAEVSLHTGRKHQIRVHAAMAGHAVLGDRRYGAEVGRAWPRLALHAAELALKHPVTGERLVVRSPIPADLASLWERAGGPSDGD